MPVSVMMTQGTDADGQQAVPLIAEKQTISWLIEATILTVLWHKQRDKAWSLLFRHEKTGRNNATMTDTLIKVGILLSMPFCTSSSGVVSQHVIPKKPALCLLPCLFDV